MSLNLTDGKPDGTMVTKTNDRATSQMASVRIRETENRAARKSNVVLFNIPLSESVDGERRKTHDITYVEILCKDCLKVEIQCRQAICLGKKGNDMRPLKVTLENESDVRSILKAKWNLKENEKYRAISIKKDMTPLEREEIRKLVRLKESRQRE